jgi:hypothetical protein
MSAPGQTASEQQFLDELSDARSSGRRVPDFFIVGHAKCGTTAMHEMLSSHPQIYFPVHKETQFLARDPGDRAAPDKRRPTTRPLTLAAYLELFDAAGNRQLAGEASTGYLRTPAAAARIAALSPDAKIVAMFRDPVDFLRSFHLQLLQVNIESEQSFAQAIGLEADRRHGVHLPRGCPWPQALYYSLHVHYVEQLRRYHELFGRENVLVLIYDDFRRDNERVVRQVQRFLGVEDTIAIEQTEANPTVRVRSHRAEQLLEAVTVGRGPVSRAAKRTVKALVPGRARRSALASVKRQIVSAAPPPRDEAFIAELRSRFKPEVAALGEYLGRDLIELWGYHDVA